MNHRGWMTDIVTLSVLIVILSIMAIISLTADVIKYIIHRSSKDKNNLEDNSKVNLIYKLEPMNTNKII